MRIARPLNGDSHTGQNDTGKGTRWKMAVLGAAVVSSVFAAAATGCTRATSPPVASSPPAASTPASAPVTLSTAAGMEIAKGEASGYRVEVFSTNGPAEPGKEMQLRFVMTDAARNQPVRKYKTVHEKDIHLILVRRDLAQFQHVHPVLQPDGSFTLGLTLPTAGSYRLFADFTPEGATQAVVPLEIKVAGTEPPAEALQPDEVLEKRFGAFLVRLDVKQAASGQSDEHAAHGGGAGSTATFTFTILDAATRRPVTLQPYLGAMGHLALVPQDASNLVHAHPEGMENMDMPGHDMSSMPSPSGGAQPVSFGAHLAGGGLYKAWGQFQIGGKVETFDFVIKAGGNSASPATGGKTEHDEHDDHGASPHTH